MLNVVMCYRKAFKRVIVIYFHFHGTCSAVQLTYQAHVMFFSKGVYLNYLFKIQRFKD